MPDGDSMAHDALKLRELRAEDLPILFEQQSDPEACRMAAVHPRPREAFDAHWANALQNPAIVAKVILVGDVVVGHIACFSSDGLDCVGYGIARQHWGRGIATRALALLLEEVATRPLHARAARSNGASIRVLERNGFAVTGYENSPGDDRYMACEEAVLVLR